MPQATSGDVGDSMERSEPRVSWIVHVFEKPSAFNLKKRLENTPSE